MFRLVTLLLVRIFSRHLNLRAKYTYVRERSARGIRRSSSRALPLRVDPERAECFAFAFSSIAARDEWGRTSSPGDCAIDRPDGRFWKGASPAPYL